MNAYVRQVASLFSRMRLTAPPLTEPEPVYAQRRPTVGLFHSLTREQQQKVRDYRGPENHGDLAFKTEAQAR
jgi:hypothetical protein